MPRIATLKCASMPSLEGMDALEFQSISGNDALGECFSYRLRAVTPDLPYVSEELIANVDFKALVGKEITVDMEVNKGRRQINALVTAGRFVESQNRRGVYEFLLEPWLVLAKRSSDFRTFINKSALEIIREVLDDFPFSHDNRTSNQYPKLDWQVQYGETAYAFITRLMAEWGIYFFHEHSNGVHRMVLVDEPGAHKPCQGNYADVKYYPPGHKVDEEHVTEFIAGHSLQTGAWVTQEYDFRAPKADWNTVSTKPRKTGHATMERYSWPSDVANTNAQSVASADQQAMARHLTRIRMEEAGTAGERASGKGMLRGMAVGNTFNLGNHPHKKSNTSYLIISQFFDLRDTDSSSGTSSYFCESAFTVQPAKDNFRMATPCDEYGRALKPRTHGPQTAVVTGPPGREQFTDQYGRVKLSFYWNRKCTKDHNSSCWVRVATTHAGTNFGGISIPRIGQEVVVDFENGDPDRPIVTGAVYNALNMPPWPLPANQTQSGLLTRSTEGGGAANANALRFEDMKGKEEVWLHAEKDQRIEVENDESHWVGHDRTKTIDHDETNHIKNDRTETVDGHETITVHKTRTETVDGDETLTVHSNRTRTVDGNETETIKMFKIENILMGHMQNVGLGKMVNVGAAYSINVGAMMITAVGASHKLNVAMNASTTVGKNFSTNVGENYTIEAGDTFSVKVGKSVLVMKSDGTITLDGKDLSLVMTGKQVITADNTITIKGSKILEN